MERRRERIPPPKEEKRERTPPPKDKSAAGGDSADADDTDTAIKSRVTVKVPEDARLWVNGVFCPLTSGTRSFETPAVEPGRLYVYTIRAEVIREGRRRSESREVVFEGGKPVTVKFDDPISVVTANE